MVKVTDTQTWQGQDSITIDYYQPNTLEMKISGVAERYLPEDTFRPVVSGSYLAGNPMAGDAFSYVLGLQMDIPKCSYRMGWNGTVSGSTATWQRRDPVLKEDDKLDANGKYAWHPHDQVQRNQFPGRSQLLCDWKIG